MKKIFTLFALCLMLAGFSVQAQASLVGVHDEFQVDLNSQIEMLQIDIPYDSVVYLFTSASSANVGLYLWDAAGNKIASNENTSDPFVIHWKDGATDGSMDTSTIAMTDAVIQISLAAGTYYVSVVPTYSSFNATNQVFDNLADLTAFRNAKGTGSINIDSTLNVVYQTSAVPIPASALLLVPGLAALGVLRRKIS